MELNALATATFILITITFRFFGWAMRFALAMGLGRQSAAHCAHCTGVLGVYWPPFQHAARRQHAVDFAPSVRI